VEIEMVLQPAFKQILARPRDPLCAVASYVVIRNGIGAIGLAFPIVLIVGGELDNIQGTLSAYYHFSASGPEQYGGGTMRDAFVGMLCAIGAFLLFYRGHSLQEDLALNIAGIAAALIALAPMDWPVGAVRATMTGRLHTVSAAIFFLMIAYVCLFRARDTLFMVPEPRVRRRFSRVYRVLGLFMLATPGAVALARLVAPAWTHGRGTILLEIAAVLVFASYWLIKSSEIRSSLRLNPKMGSPASGMKAAPEHVGRSSARS
jgi:hypothetical protein